MSKTPSTTAQAACWRCGDLSLAPEVGAMWDAVDALSTGDTFTVRGRTYIYAGPHGWGGCDYDRETGKGGEFTEVSVFKHGGGTDTVRVRPSCPPVMVGGRA